MERYPGYVEVAPYDRPSDTACIHCILGTNMQVFRHVHHYGSDSQNHVVVTYRGNQIFGLLYVSETKGVYTKTEILLPGGPLKH